MFIIVNIIIRVKETTAVPCVCVKPGLDASWPGGSRMARLTSGGPLVAGRKLFGPSWLSRPTETQHFTLTEGILNCWHQL